MSSSLEFENLLKLARQGNQEALTQLTKQYEIQIRVVARSRLGSTMRGCLDSADIVQSVHRSLLDGLQRDRFHFTSPAQLTALAMTMMHRKIALYWRRMKHRPRYAQEAEVSLAETVVGVEEDPGALASAKDQMEKIYHMLTEHERRIISLRLEGWRTVDIARELNINADVLRVKLSRLRSRLRKIAKNADWM